METEGYSESPFHRPMSPPPPAQPAAAAGNETDRARHAALTAHVLIALEETASALIVSHSNLAKRITCKPLSKCSLLPRLIGNTFKAAVQPPGNRARVMCILV